MQKAIIFDMDGVIIDSNPFHLISWRQFLLQKGIEATDQQLKDHMFGKSNTYICKHFIDPNLTKEQIDILQYEKEKLFREIFEPDGPIVPGFEAFFTQLLDEGYKTGIGTSAPFLNLEMAQRMFPVLNEAHSAMAEEDVRQHKPHPEVYLKTAERLGVQPKDCVVFEDSFSGVTAALNAGMKVIGVLTTYTPDELPPCHAYIKDYTEMTVELVAEILAS